MACRTHLKTPQAARALLIAMARSQLWWESRCRGQLQPGPAEGLASGAWGRPLRNLLPIEHALRLLFYRAPFFATFLRKMLEMCVG